MLKITSTSMAVATDPFVVKTVQQTNQGRGMLVMGHHQLLVPVRAHAAYSKKGGTVEIAEGDIVWLKGDQAGATFADQIFRDAEGYRFLLVPEDRVVGVTRGTGGSPADPELELARKLVGRKFNVGGRGEKTVLWVGREPAELKLLAVLDQMLVVPVTDLGAA